MFAALFKLGLISTAFAIVSVTCLPTTSSVFSRSSFGHGNHRVSFRRDPQDSLETFKDMVSNSYDGGSEVGSLQVTCDHSMIYCNIVEAASPQSERRGISLIPDYGGRKFDMRLLTSSASKMGNKQGESKTNGLVAIMKKLLYSPEKFKH